MIKRGEPHDGDGMAGNPSGVMGRALGAAGLTSDVVEVGGALSPYSGGCVEDWRTGGSQTDGTGQSPWP
jgi:hypothetical protein